MNFFVTLTTACDLQCRYCYGECCDDFDVHDDSFVYDFFLPRAIAYETGALKTFLAKDESATIIFYGGEPLLEIPRMLELMDTLPAKRFLLHTNGTMLDRVPAAYLRRLNTISVSIDGDRALTDYSRGTGVYDRDNGEPRKAREKGYAGEIIARMTVTEGTDIYRQVLHLLDNPDFAFYSIHWQLNALFWQNDRSRRQFSGWVAESYNPGISRLVSEWLRVMREEGKVTDVVPLRRRHAVPAQRREVPAALRGRLGRVQRPDGRPYLALSCHVRHEGLLCRRHRHEPGRPEESPDRRPVRRL